MRDDLDRLLGHLEQLVAEIDELEGPARSSVYELLDGIDALHRNALHALAEELDGASLRHARRARPAVDWLLSAYGVGADDRQVVETAIDRVRPYIHSHGGDIEVLDVQGGVARVRLGGACSGCSASAITLRHGVEEALEEHWPGFVGLEVEEEDAAPHDPPGPTLVDLDTSLLDSRSDR